MLKHPRWDEYREELLRWAKTQEFDVLVADAAQTLIRETQLLTNELSEVRRGAVRNMAEMGYSQTDIASELGLTRGRIEQILK